MALPLSPNCNVEVKVTQIVIHIICTSALHLKLWYTHIHECARVKQKDIFSSFTVRLRTCLICLMPSAHIVCGVLHSWGLK